MNLDPAAWAEHGGLIGLVLLALFILIGVFIRVIAEKDKHHRNFVTTKDEKHQKFIQEILESAKEERTETQKINRENAQALSSAITDLTEVVRSQPAK